MRKSQFTEEQILAIIAESRTTAVSEVAAEFPVKLTPHSWADRSQFSSAER